MSPFVSTVNQDLSLLTIGSQIAIILFLGALVCVPQKRQQMLTIIGKYAVMFSFVVALTATLGSLFYSEIAEFEPCKLCWFQRILMYPQVVLFGIALWSRDTNVGKYGIAFSGIGAVIAGYHYFLQRGIAPELPCSAVGYSVACSKVFVMNFGYITLPLMAFTAFVLILLVHLVGRKTA